MKIVLVDNFDSFVYNLAQYLGALGVEPIVLRNDLGIARIEQERPDAVVISPGPGRPEDAGMCVELIQRLGGSVPILGVCLGHQAIAVAYGGDVVRADRVMHGKTSKIEHRSTGVFAGLPNPLEATRYHSLVVDPASMPSWLEVTASTADGVVMGLRHTEKPVEGVQFHPESVLTESGMDLLRNFLAGVRP